MDRFNDYIKRVVDDAPPLSDGQREELAAIFRRSEPKTLADIPPLNQPDADANSEPLEVRLD